MEKISKQQSAQENLKNTFPTIQENQQAKTVSVYEDLNNKINKFQLQDIQIGTRDYTFP